MVSIKLYYSCVRRAPFVRNQKRYKFLRRFTEKWKFSRNYKYLRSYTRLFVKTKKKQHRNSIMIPVVKFNISDRMLAVIRGRLSPAVCQPGLEKRRNRTDCFSVLTLKLLLWLFFLRIFFFLRWNGESGYWRVRGNKKIKNYTAIIFAETIIVRILSVCCNHINIVSTMIIIPNKTIPNTPVR